MRTKLHIIMIALLSIGLVSCGSTKTTAQKQENASIVRQKVNDLNFTFTAKHAFPTSFKSVYLSPYYNVKVSSDTITSHLPYYGRAYSAPMDPTEGGIKFTSTTFNYEVKQGKKSGNWLVDIKVKDKGNNVSLLFDIWENGTARLTVSDSKRQPISFTGDIELDEEE